MITTAVGRRTLHSLTHSLALEFAIPDPPIHPSAMPKKWLPLEANPEVMNTFARALGLSAAYAFHDVFGFEPELLEFVPSPCVAVLLLFPLTPATESVEGVDDASTPSAENVWFAKQTVSNACGTMGVIHAALNARDATARDGYFERLRARCEGLDADARAKVIEEDDALEAAHVGASVEGQSAVPTGDEEVDLHFVALVEVDGGVWELDGRKPGPVYHGATTGVGLLRDAVPVIKKYMDAAAGSINFNATALAADMS